jgi:hypothetical protein
MNCPRCGHLQTESTAAECAACGVILAKAKPPGARGSRGEGDRVTEAATDARLPAMAAGAAADASVADAASAASAGSAAGAEPDSQSWLARAAAVLMEEDRADQASLLGRTVLLIVLLPWTWTFATSSVVSNAAGQSWLHLIDLVFHEAGHVLFLPFGAFMTTLGGSLTQLIVPAGLMVVFLTQHRDPFGAAVTGWWFGENVIDLAPYIDDARNLQMVLLGGKTGAEVEGHDWERILMTLGWLHLDHTLGRLAATVGTVIMLAALAWAALLLIAHWRRARTTSVEIV